MRIHQGVPPGTTPLLIITTILVMLVYVSPSSMLIWVLRSFQCSKIRVALNIGEGEGHIWVKTKVWRVNVRNLEKIQEKRLLFQRFVTSIVAPPRSHFMIASTGSILTGQSQVTPDVWKIEKIICNCTFLYLQGVGPRYARDQGAQFRDLQRS